MSFVHDARQAWESGDRAGAVDVCVNAQEYGVAVRLLREQGFLDEAQELTDRSIHGYRRQGRLDRAAYVAFELGDYAQAETLFREALKFPSTADAGKRGLDFLTNYEASQRLLAEASRLTPVRAD